MVRRLTVVIPLWASRYDRGSDELRREKDSQYAALIGEPSVAILIVIGEHEAESAPSPARQATEAVF